MLWYCRDFSFTGDVVELYRDETKGKLITQSLRALHILSVLDKLYKIVNFASPLIHHLANPVMPNKYQPL